MKTKIKFTLPAGHVIGADQCVLLGEFNEWNPEAGYYLQKQADGSMTTEVELTTGKDYQYRYLLSNGRWVNDDGEKVTTQMSGYPVVNCLVRVPEIVEKTVTPKPKVARTKAAAKTKPVIAKEDLTKIEGIGKKIEVLLYKNNIQSYKQLAKATIKGLKEILNEGGSKFSMHDPGSWPKQAKLAAADKWDELTLLQQQLKGGK